MICKSLKPRFYSQQSIENKSAAHQLGQGQQKAEKVKGTTKKNSWRSIL